MFRTRARRVCRGMYLSLLILGLSGVMLLATPRSASAQFGPECYEYETLINYVTYTVSDCTYLHSTELIEESVTTTEACSLGRTKRKATQEVTLTTGYNLVTWRIEQWLLATWLSPETGGTWRLNDVRYDYVRMNEVTIETRTECVPVHGQPPKN